MTAPTDIGALMSALERLSQATAIAYSELALEARLSPSAPDQAAIRLTLAPILPLARQVDLRAHLMLAALESNKP